jgi:hypothetical protein
MTLCIVLFISMIEVVLTPFLPKLTERKNIFG